MGILDSIKSLFSSTGGAASSGVDSDKRAMYFYVSCNACGEKIRVRVDMYNDLAQEFDSKERVSGYVLNKDVLGSKCFKLMRLHLQMDPSRRLIAKSIENGTFITKEQYLQGQP